MIYISLHATQIPSQCNYDLTWNVTLYPTIHQGRRKERKSTLSGSRFLNLEGTPPIKCRLARKKTFLPSCQPYKGCLGRGGGVLLRYCSPEKLLSEGVGESGLLPDNFSSARSALKRHSCPSYMWSLDNFFMIRNKHGISSKKRGDVNAI